MTKAEFITELEARISAAKVSGFWSASQKLSWINQAGDMVCNMKPWPFLQKALTTQTRDSKEYYDYPPSPNAFRSNSIYQIDIEGEDYGDLDGRTRCTWEEFQRRKNYGDTSEYIFANHDSFYFLYPVPTDSVTLSVWGLLKWKNLVNDNDTPVTPTELDNSIVKIALASCLRKAKKYNEAKAELVEAIDPNVGTVQIYWQSITVNDAGGYAGDAQSSRF